MIALIKLCRFCGEEYTGRAFKYCSVGCRNKGNLQYHVDRRKQSVENTLRTVVAGCKARAKKWAMKCDIDYKYVAGLLKQQEGKCAVTGITLESSAGNTRVFSHPKTVSVDRIIPDKGYTKDNIRLVTFMYNSCKGRWTDADVLEMCRAVVN